MKNILILCLIFFAACKKSDNTTTTPSTTRSASFKVGSNAYTVSKPYLGIFDNNGTIKNTLTLTATDGSVVELGFTGSSPSTYTLNSFNSANFKNASGKQYYSTSGELITSAYTTDGTTNKATGTFHFKAKASAAPIDSVEITTGIFTNASNEL